MAAMTTEGEAETTNETTTGDESAELPNANGQKELTLEDLQLWSSMDMDRDGKLTIAEFDRFVRSPTSRAFVSQMKEEKAIQQWADKMGIDVAKAKQAMAMGAQAQAAALQQRQMAAQYAVAQRRRAAVGVAQRRQAQVNNYFANLGRQYYRALSGRRRDEL